MFKIAIRADACRNIGFGHVMRCLSLAKAFREKGCTVCFVSRYEEGFIKIKEHLFEVIRLGNITTAGGIEPAYDNMSGLEQEAEDVVNIVKRHGMDLLFIDTYRVTQEYFLKIKPHVKKLAYIDDINQFIYPVDILVNGNITGKYLGYRKYSEEETLLLGPEYNLIRNEFADLPARQVNEKVSEIMLTTGGSDPHHMTARIVGMLLADEELRRLRINVVVGSAFEDRKQLREINRKNGNVVLYENVKRMSEVMLRSDVAVSAGGSTLYELCACGTPGLAFVMADNQQGIVEKMDELGYMQSLGWYNAFPEGEVINKVKALCSDYARRTALSGKMQCLVDGRGARRVAERVLELLK